MKLSNTQNTVIEKLQEFNNNKEINYLYIKHSVLEYIFELDITSSSKLLLVYLIKNITLDFKHLYIVTPYAKLIKELKLSKSTFVRCLKELNEKKLLTLLSGTNIKKNNKIKEFIFGRKQFSLNTKYEYNIVDMTVFFKRFFRDSGKK